jgi:hypothetical protein
MQHVEVPLEESEEKESGSESTQGLPEGLGAMLAAVCDSDLSKYSKLHNCT